MASPLWQKIVGLEKPARDDGEFHSYPELQEKIAAAAHWMRQAGYLDFPYFVHLETLAVCNAACEFCPYVELKRQGARMPDSLIEKIIGELAQAERKLPFLLAPYKVSDPFLEPRLFDIMALVASRLPQAKIALITNGSPLTPRKLERLAGFRNVAYLNVSLNADNPEEYERVMRLPFHRVLKRLDELHEQVARGRIPFPVRVTRVSAGRSADLRYLSFCRARYPGFEALVAPRNDWLGEVITPGAHGRVPDAPCHRWFDLSVVADGKVAFCCMDGQAQYAKGDATREHVLDIYNAPALRSLRAALPDRRKAAEPCRRCTYLTG